MWQQVLSIALVALALAYVLWRWLPAGWRARLVRLHPRLARALPAPSGCGGCSSCAPGCASTRVGAAQPPAGVAQEAVVQMPRSRRAETGMDMGPSAGA